MRLFEHGFLEFSEKVAKIKISAKGKTALNSDSKKLTSPQLKVLKACQKKAIPPSDTRISAAQGRQAVIEELKNLGLISISTKIDQVWLTDAGREYLASEYTPTGGGNIILSKKMLADYLEFLRGYFSTARPTPDVKSPAAELPANLDVDDNEIYQAIVSLDRQHSSENYLPIFHLRNQFPSLTRKEARSGSLPITGSRQD